MDRRIKIVAIVTTLLVVVAGTVENNSGNCNNLGGNWYYEETPSPGVTCPGNFQYRWFRKNHNLVLNFHKGLPYMTSSQMGEGGVQNCPQVADTQYLNFTHRGEGVKIPNNLWMSNMEDS